MDTYLNVYKGYYVSCGPGRGSIGILEANADNSLRVTVLDETTKAITGSAEESTMSLMFLGIDCPPPKSKQLSSSTVSLTLHHRAPSLIHNTDAVAEAAVVGVNDELTGQAVNAFVALKDGFDHNDQIRKDLILQVRKSIGPFAAPKAVYIVSDLPKTRSGKIMRRILRKILAGEEDQLGDTSTVGLHMFLLEWL